VAAAKNGLRRSIADSLLQPRDGFVDKMDLEMTILGRSEDPYGRIVDAVTGQTRRSVLLPPILPSPKELQMASITMLIARIRSMVRKSHGGMLKAKNRSGEDSKKSHHALAAMPLWRCRCRLLGASIAQALG
jgi:hypothetical protein